MVELWDWWQVGMMAAGKVAKTGICVAVTTDDTKVTISEEQLVS